MSTTNEPRTASGTAMNLILIVTGLLMMAAFATILADRFAPGWSARFGIDAPTTVQTLPTPAPYPTAAIRPAAPVAAPIAPAIESIVVQPAPVVAPVAVEVPPAIDAPAPPAAPVTIRIVYRDGSTQDATVHSGGVVTGAAACDVTGSGVRARRCAP